MHLPELALAVRSLGRSMRGRRFGMVPEWQVLEDELNLAAVLLLDFLEGRTDPRAVGSLKVGELYNLNGGRGRADGR